MKKTEEVVIDSKERRIRDTSFLMKSATHAIFFSLLTFMTQKFSLAEDLFRGAKSSEKFATHDLKSLRDDVVGQYNSKGFFGKITSYHGYINRLSKEISKQGMGVIENFKNQSNLSKATSLFAVSGLIFSSVMLVRELVGKKVNVSIKVENYGALAEKPESPYLISQSEAEQLSNMRTKEKKQMIHALEEREKAREVAHQL